MEWPKKKPQNKEKPLVLDRVFDDKFQKHTTESIKSERSLEGVSTPNEFIEALDFPVLNDIFRSVLTKSGSPNKDLYKIIDSSDVHIDTEDRSETAAQYSFEDGIVLNWRKIVADANVLKEVLQQKEMDTSEHSLVGLAALQNLIHEHLHKISRIRLEVAEYNPTNFLPEEIELTKGFTQNGDFVSLDEAVTEQIAQELFDSYLIRTGNRASLQLSERIMFGATNYLFDRVLLHKLLDLLSEKIGIDRDIVWRGFVREYMNGDEAPRTLLENVRRELEDNPENRKLLDILESKQSIRNEDNEEVKQRFEEIINSDVLEKMIPNIIPEHFSDALRIR